jgi:hypothetical protein
VIGRTHPRFWKHFSTLPVAVQKLAREKYALWTQNPHHPSLRFEERRNGICVVRIGDRYRAVGIHEGDIVAWFWIGTHEDYNRFRF